MEYLDGETLATRLERGALSLEDALSVAIQIADGLDQAHQHGVVHRDLKPANVMLVQSGASRSGVPHVKLLDFGLAKFFFFQAEDGIRVGTVTGVQTCALPI